MTDSEIIKALKVCTTAGASCKNCPAYVKVDRSKCKEAFRGALDLINRQKAEIERLSMEVDELIIAKDLLFDEAEALIKKAKAEAIKEFAERLKGIYRNIPTLWGTVAVKHIDNLVKEMVGE